MNRFNFLRLWLFVVAVLILFAVQPLRAQQPAGPLTLVPNGVGLTQSHAVSAASNNSTLVAAGLHVLYAVNLTNTNAATAYVRFYDLATAPTCTSATGVKLSFTLLQSKPVARFNLLGNHFANGISYCVTGAFGDTDNTNATTGISIDTMYK
jgi:hypothetical protein